MEFKDTTIGEILKTGFFEGNYACDSIDSRINQIEEAAEVTNKDIRIIFERCNKLLTAICSYYYNPETETGMFMSNLGKKVYHRFKDKPTFGLLISNLESYYSDIVKSVKIDFLNAIKYSEKEDKNICILLSLFFMDLFWNDLDNKAFNLFGKDLLETLLLTDDFNATGYMATSNSGGLEIEISNSGDAARLRFDDATVTDWLEIEYEFDSPEADENYIPTYIEYNDIKYYLDKFMKY